MSTPHRHAALDDIVFVQTLAFPGFFMTQLGPWFLREYYRCVLDYPRGIVVTEHDTLGCVGFAAGFIEPSSFYQGLRRRRLRLGLAALLGIAARPMRIGALLENYRRAGGMARQTGDASTAELSSLAVRPDRAGRGTGSRLVTRFVADARHAGAARVVLTTDTYENDRVNRFYQRLGFRCARTVEARRGRVLNEYVIDTARD